MNYRKNNNEEETAEYLVDAGAEHCFPHRSIAVAVNLHSGDFVSARMHTPMGPTHAEQVALLLAALQTPRASVIYTDSKGSAELYQKYVEKGDRVKLIIRCINQLLLPSTKIIFIPRQQNRLADALARYCQKNDFTGYGQCYYEKGKIFVSKTRESTLNEVINLGRAIANHRQVASL